MESECAVWESPFLSTPSARRATVERPAQAACSGISIHALREEGDSAPGPFVPAVSISIHALREEGDGRAGRSDAHHSISIHALREEGDSCR